MSRRRAPALGAGAGALAWLALVVVLAATTNPLVSVAAFVTTVIACRASGTGRIVWFGLVAGVGVCLALPAVSVADGSFRFVYGGGQFQWPSDAATWTRAVATLTRVPAQLMAVGFLLLVPARLMTSAFSRLHGRGALLAGLAARVQPLLRHDAGIARDLLASRGARFERGAPLGMRIRSALGLWELLVSGLVDRAFTTAAALRVRGFGASSAPTTDVLRDPALSDGSATRRGRDVLVAGASIAAVIVVVFGRATGLIASPQFALFGAAHEQTGAAALVCAMLILVPGILVGRAARERGVMIRRAAPTSTSSFATLAALDAQPRVRARADAPVVFELRGASMTYPGRTAPAVQDVSLELRQGELVLLVGPSGGGKSTILDLVSGVAPSVTGGAAVGDVIVDGRVTRVDDHHVRARAAAVFQMPDAQVIVGDVAEEVAFGPRQAGLPILEIERVVAESLARLGIAHLAHRSCATLSGGELQRVLLAAALAMRPRVLVLDEPTSQIDATSALVFWQAIDAARAELGVAVIVAEHRTSLVRRRCDRIVAVQDGMVSPAAAAHDDDDAQLLNDLAPGHPLPHPRLQVTARRIAAGPHAPVVLRDLAFTVPAGAIVTLEGSNGSGKSTFLRALRGLVDFDGDVLVDGRRRGDVAGSSTQMGWLAQAAGPGMLGRTVRESIQRGSTLSDADVARLVLGAGLVERIGDHPADLSVGERQRVAMLGLVASAVPIWLLDEPTRGMDPVARRWVALHVLQHASRGGVVLVATHDPAFAAAVATHRLRLDPRSGPHLVQVLRDVDGRPTEERHASISERRATT